MRDNNKRDTRKNRIKSLQHFLDISISLLRDLPSVNLQVAKVPHVILIIPLNDPITLGMTM